MIFDGVGYVRIHGDSAGAWRAADIEQVLGGVVAVADATPEAVPRSSYAAAQVGSTTFRSVPPTSLVRAWMLGSRQPADTYILNAETSRPHDRRVTALVRLALLTLRWRQDATHLMLLTHWRAMRNDSIELLGSVLPPQTCVHDEGPYFPPIDLSGAGPIGRDEPSVMERLGAQPNHLVALSYITGPTITSALGDIDRVLTQGIGVDAHQAERHRAGILGIDPADYSRADWCMSTQPPLQAARSIVQYAAHLDPTAT